MRKRNAYQGKIEVAKVAEKTLQEIKAAEKINIDMLQRVNRSKPWELFRIKLAEVVKDISITNEPDRKLKKNSLKRIITI